MTILDKLKSRKFWFALVGAILPIVMQLLTGELTWELAVAASVTVIVGYLFGQGYVDGKTAEAAMTVVTEAPAIGAGGAE